MNDCVEAIKRLTSAGPDDSRLIRIVLSELGSLHPAANRQREKTRADKLEALVDSLAEKVTEAAQADIDHASERSDSLGNVCANVPMSFPETVKWLTYAHSRGNGHARRILDHIEALRAPLIPRDDDSQDAAAVYSVNLPKGVS